MRRVVLLRLLQAIPLIVVSTMVIFFAVSLAGDPLDRYRQPNVPQSTLDAKAAELGLDRPIAVRYWEWISHAVRGDFGLNDRGVPVGQELLDRSLVSLRLIAIAVVLAILAAVAVGFYGAVRRGRPADRLLTAFTILMLTAPEFWVAVVMKQLAIWFNQRTGTDLLATVGDSTPGIASAGLGERLGDYAGHLVLPTAVLVLGMFPVWALYQRTAMLEVIDSDYVKMARAKGLTNTRVLVRHGLRTALTPVVTMIALRLPWVVGGLVVIESIFGWRGLGTMLVQGVQKQDTNTVLAFLLLSAVLITVLNLAADLIHRYLDPRVRYD
ncbi:ABC transporter permease [Streptosporangium sp. NPDC051022]|uniref:ABC transporter permease n=1 Tax=Streptosporangium sp. NPDC051022 TaxID=3155752 RepID=UPI003446B59F